MNVMTPTLAAVEDGVHVIDLGSGENRITVESLSRLTELLDEVGAAPPPRALVTTGSGRCFSTGLDLDWIQAQPDGAGELVVAFQEALAKILTASMYTVAAVQGHCFAGGAMLATAHDAVVMNSDHGVWCLPEADLPVVFTDGMAALLSARLPSATARQAMVTGRKYSAVEAVAGGIAYQAAGSDELLEVAIELARPQRSKDPASMAGIKQRLYSPVADRLRHLGDDMPSSFPAYQR